MALLRVFQVLFILFALHTSIVFSQETEDVTDAEEEKDNTDDEPVPEDTDEKDETTEDEAEPDEKKDDETTPTDLCSLPDLDKMVDHLMALVNPRIPITHELPNRRLRTMTISDISVSNLNSMFRYRSPAISCPGGGQVVLTIPLRSLRPIISLFRWSLHFPNGVGGRVSMSIADFDADAVVSLESDADKGVHAKLMDLKLMKLDGISIQTSGYGGIIGFISDHVTTLLVSNFRGLFRNFVQRELSKIVADEMIQIPLTVPKKGNA